MLLEAAKLIKNGERTVRVIVDDRSENQGSIVDPVFADLPILERRAMATSLGREGRGR